MNFSSLAVVGFGQMGASLAAAWKSPGTKILAIDHDPEVLRKARQRGWADEGSERLEDCRHASVVLLALPVRTLVQLLPRVLLAMEPNALLLDVASTKGSVVEAYRKEKSTVPYLSLHPLAGTEQSGIDSADLDLFRKAPFVVLPVRASEEIVLEMEAKIRAIGAHPIRMASAEEHDAAMAVTIHLPHVLAYVLPHLAKESATDLLLAGRSFRDSTRVALSDIRMVQDFLATNPQKTASAIDRLIGLLNKFRDQLVSGDDPKIARFMEEAKEIRSRLS